MFTACTDDLNLAEEVGSPSESSAGNVVVSLDMSGDFLDISEAPITRAGATKKRFYAVNVYTRTKDDYQRTGDDVIRDTKFGDNTVFPHKGDTVWTWKKYAYGLFTDKSQMKLSLPSNKDYIYKFECTIVQEDRDEVFFGTTKYWEQNEKQPKDFCLYPFNSLNNNYKTWSSSSYTTVSKFFITDSEKSDFLKMEKLAMTATMNKFVYSQNNGNNSDFSYATDVNLSEIKGGFAYTKLIGDGINVPLVDDKINGNIDGKKPDATEKNQNEKYFYSLQKCPGFDRFYGEIDNYVADNNGTVTIPMKRTGYQIKFAVTPFSEGSLKIKCPETFDIDLTPSVSTQTVESFYSFENVYECWAVLKNFDRYISTKYTGKGQEQKAQEDIEELRKADVNKYEQTEKVITFIRVRKDGSRQEFNKRLCVKRNMSYTIAVDAESMSVNGVVIDDSEQVEQGEVIFL